MAVEINEGEAFVEGLTQENAKALLEAAASLDIAVYEVRTASGGFVVPEAVADKAFPPKKETAAQRKAREKREAEEQAEGDAQADEAEGEPETKDEENG